MSGPLGGDDVGESLSTGLSVNGLSVDGLSVNGLSMDGLGVDGMDDELHFTRDDWCGIVALLSAPIIEIPTADIPTMDHIIENRINLGT